MHFLALIAGDRFVAMGAKFAEVAVHPEDAAKHAIHVDRRRKRLSVLGALRILSEFACFAPGTGPKSGVGTELLLLTCRHDSGEAMPRWRYATASASISTTNRGSASPATNSNVEAGACSPNNAVRAAR
jgi:hypothetical protein